MAHNNPSGSFNWQGMNNPANRNQSIQEQRWHAAIDQYFITHNPTQAQIK